MGNQNERENEPYSRIDTCISANFFLCLDRNNDHESSEDIDLIHEDAPIRRFKKGQRPSDKRDLSDTCDLRKNN